MLPSHVRYYLHTKSFYLAIVGVVFLLSLIGNIYFGYLVSTTSLPSQVQASEIITLR